MARRFPQAPLIHEARTRPVRRFEQIVCVHGDSLAVEKWPGRFECARCGDVIHSVVHTEQRAAA